MSQADIDHAVFVRREYRRTIVTSATVKARNDSAREVALDTNLDVASATRIANAMLAENINPRAFEVEFEGTLGTNPLAGGPPSYTLTTARYDLVGYTAKSFSINEDYEKNTTVIQVRG